MRPNPSHPVKRRRFYGMTIGIGLICKGGIVLASDSRTEDESGRKRFDLDKISAIECGEIKCLIVRSGMTSLSGRALELVRKAVIENPPRDRGHLLELIRQSVSQVRRDFLFTNPNLHYSDPTGRFHLIVALHDGKPSLHVINSNEGAIQAEESGAYIGSGQILADYILGGLDTESMEPGDAMWAAFYAVEIAKLKDSACEGPTKVAVIHPAKTVHFLDDELLAQSSIECLAYETANRKLWVTSMANWIDSRREAKD